MSSVDEVWERMNQSERFGCKFGLFPAWIEDYRLSHEDITELMRKSDSFLGGIARSQRLYD